MTPRFNLFFRWFARRFFAPLRARRRRRVERLRELEARGSVVYVMRYASRLDYFLFNALFLREGLRLSAFANGIASGTTGRCSTACASGGAAARARRRGRRGRRARATGSAVRELVARAQSLFLFLRTERLRAVLRGREAAVEQGAPPARPALRGGRRRGVGPARCSLVPLALFWRKGPRASRRVLNLSYGAPTRPTDLAKVTGFLIAYRELAIKVGEPIDLTAFVGERRAEGSQAPRAQGAALDPALPLPRGARGRGAARSCRATACRRSCCSHPAVAAVVAERAPREAHDAGGGARARPSSIFREIAANMNSTFLAILNFVGERDLQAPVRRHRGAGPREGRRATRSATRSCSCRATARTSTS